MAKRKNKKIFGTLIDRNMKIIRNNYLKVFKEIGLDITTEQWVLMDCLYQQNGMSQTELANGSFKNAPTVSRIIDLLCKKELTERQRFDNDRRRYKVFLTQKGKTAYEKALTAVEKLRKQGWKKLTNEDYDNFVRMMNQIYQNYDGGE